MMGRSEMINVGGEKKRGGRDGRKGRRHGRGVGGECEWEGGYFGRAYKKIFKMVI